MTTDQKGAVAQAKIVARAVELGIPVLWPLNDGLRYDLVFDVGTLVRVQCKWARRRGDAVVVPMRTCRRGAVGLVRTAYTSAEIDAVAAFVPELDECFYVPMAPFDGQTMVNLRLSRPRNNQRRGIHWAKDYEFGATLGAAGP
jgi:hypothetical protein